MRAKSILFSEACLMDIPTYPAPTTQTLFTGSLATFSMLRRCASWVSTARSSDPEGRNSGLEAGVVGPVEQKELASDAPDDDKTSIGMSSAMMILGGRLEVGEI
jgi:hypothetical protein